jgi:NADPH:quinone reductase-like Zn-dependent oxidoreductase
MVQIAKTLGAHVTGVCSTRNVELVRSLGAHRVIDYTREDFTRSGERYDVIMDNVGNLSVFARLRMLKPGGVCVGVGFTSIGLLIQNMLLGRLLASMQNKKITSMLAHMKREDLTVLKELMEAGKVVPVVHKCYSLNQVPEAYRYLKTRHAPGKLVINFER